MRSQTTAPVVQRPKGRESWSGLGKRVGRNPLLPSPSLLLPLLFSLRFIIYWYNSKYQSKGPIYILHLFAFNLQQLDFFNLFIFEKRKRDSGKRWKKCGMQDFRGKGEGMRDQKSPPPPPPDHEWCKQSLIERSPIQHWGHHTPEQKKCLTMLNVKFERSTRSSNISTVQHGVQTAPKMLHPITLNKV